MFGIVFAEMGGMFDRTYNVTCLVMPATQEWVENRQKSLGFLVVISQQLVLIQLGRNDLLNNTPHFFKNIYSA